MDCLTFGCETLIKNMKTKKDPIIEVRLDEVLKGLEMDMKQFIDFCILSGCDYLPTIPKLGPGTALKLIKEHKCIEDILEVLKIENEHYEIEKGHKKWIIPLNYDFQTARDLFNNPDVDEVYPEVKVQPPKI